MLAHELDAGNKEHVALVIAEHMASTKTQWLYGRHERSLIEKTAYGRIFFAASVYPRSLVGAVMSDAHNIYRMAKTEIDPDVPGRRNYTGMMQAASAIGMRLVLMSMFEKMMNEIFGYRARYGWGWKATKAMMFEPGSLMEVPTKFIGDVSDPVKNIVSSLESFVAGDMDEYEMREGLASATKVLASGLDNMGMQTIIGLKFTLGIVEAVLGKEDKSIKPLRGLVDMALDEYEPAEIEYTLRQQFQKAMGGGGGTYDEYMEAVDAYEPKISDPQTWTFDWMKEKASDAVSGW